MSAGLLSARARAVTPVPTARSNCSRKAFAQGELHFFNDLAHLNDAAVFSRHLACARSIEWVVYAKPKAERSPAFDIMRPVRAEWVATAVDAADIPAKTPAAKAMNVNPPVQIDRRYRRDRDARRHNIALRSTIPITAPNSPRLQSGLYEVGHRQPNQQSRPQIPLQIPASVARL